MRASPYRGATRILVVLALINLASYAARNALFAVYDDLEKRFAIDYAQFGFLQTAFMIPHAVATLPFGWAGDAYDRRRVIAFGLVVAGIAGALGAVGTAYEGLVASRAAVGLATAAVVPVANSILGQLYDGPRKASRMAVFNLGLFLGGVAGFGAGAALGFPLVVIAIAVPLIVLAVALLALPVPAHSHPPPAGSVARYLAGFARNFVAEARELVAIRTLRWVMVSTTAMAFAAGCYNAFLLEYLKSSSGKDMSEADATSVLIAAMCGALAGIVAGGWFGDRLRASRETGRLWMIAIGMSSSIPAAAFAILVDPGPLLYVAGVLTMFCFSLYHAPMAATVDDLAPDGRRVAAQGLVIGVMHLLGTAPSSWVLGAISDATNLTYAMWVPLGFLALAAVAMIIATRTFAADRARARAADPAL